MSEAVSESDKKGWGLGLKKGREGSNFTFPSTAILRILLFGISFESTLP